MFPCVEDFSVAVDECFVKRGGVFVIDLSFCVCRTSTLW